MLIMTRKPLERIRIKHGDREIWVSLVAIREGSVRLGFDGPDEFEIAREELLERDGDAGREHAAVVATNGERDRSETGSLQQGASDE